MRSASTQSVTRELRCHGARSADSGQGKLWYFGRSIEGFYPSADGLTKIFDRNSLELSWKFLQPPQRGAQQGRGAREIPALEVMESRSDLDQGLEKGLIRLGALEPFGFPMLVSGEKLLVEIAVKSVRQGTACPFKEHCFHYRFGSRCGLCGQPSDIFVEWNSCSCSTVALVWPRADKTASNVKAQVRETSKGTRGFKLRMLNVPQFWTESKSLESMEAPNPEPWK